MAAPDYDGKAVAIQEARQQLRAMGVPTHIVERRVAAALRQQPDMDGNELVELIRDAAYQEHMAGPDCC